MTKTETTYSQKADEISIRKLILAIREYLILLLKRWYLIIPLAFILGAYQFYTTSQILPTYPGQIILLLQPQDIAKENQTAVLIYSRLIASSNFLEELLLEKIEDQDTNTLVINRYLKTYHQHKPSDLPAGITPDFYFQHHERSNFTPEEQLVFKLILNKITTPVSGFKDGFISITTDEKLGFVTIHIATPLPELTLLLLDKVQTKTINLLSKTTTFAPQIAFDNISEETDSLAEGYKRVYYELNKKKAEYERLLKDTTNTQSRRIQYLQKKIIRLEVDAEIYKTGYLSSLKLLKNSKVNMDASSLFVQVLEKTRAPIDAYRPSAKVSAVKGATLGAVLMVLLIVSVKLFQDVMKEV